MVLFATRAFVYIGGRVIGPIEANVSGTYEQMLMRKQFEERQWKKEENFMDYFHQKVILANRIKIEDDEMIDYIIAGIPDASLRDQARIHGHTTKESLLSAFEQVSPWKISTSYSKYIGESVCEETRTE